MKKTLITLVILLFIFSTSQTKANNNPDNYVPNRILVKFKNTTAREIRKQLSNQQKVNLSNLPRNLTKINNQYRVKNISPIISNFKNIESQGYTSFNTNNNSESNKLGNIYKIELDLQPGQTFNDALEAYKSNPDIEYAEPDYYVTIDFKPNDPENYAQWSLEKIEAQKAWDIYTGNSKTIVAVLDTGVDYNHPDLQNNMWINEEELNGIDGIDDDKNGYVDDIHGYNFIYRNNNPIDDHGHGTHCAGIIAAEGNNKRDITGICWNAKIMALKFINTLGNGSVSDAILAHHYAIESGAKVISNSWSTLDKSQALFDVINYANSRGVIVVASAGNYNSSEFRYPAAFEKVISVAATDMIDNRWYYSNYGEWVDIAAPGSNILSLLANNSEIGIPYDSELTLLTGTSAACPHIAGACALLLSANPYLTCSQVENILTRTTDTIPDGICSSGRLNLYKAMQAAIPSQGYLSFDREYYSSDNTINILLVDNDLKEKTSHVITITTSDTNDLEKIILIQTEPNLGVFAGTINTSSDTRIQNDGTLQVESGEIVTATYYDSFTGMGVSLEPETETVYIDSEPPVLESIHIETQLRSARISFQANEPTKAVLHYGTTDSNTYSYSEEDLFISQSHTIKLQSLALNTNYRFVIDLVDRAENLTIADNNGYGYSFSTSEEYIDFLVPQNYPTIQAAIDDASDGDIIIVADGIYSGKGNHDIDFKGKSISLKSENGPDNCIIDCESMTIAFDFHNGEDANSILEGFTIKNGSAEDYGGAIQCIASSPSIMNCIFKDNFASEYGGAIVNMYSSSPTLTNCTFKDNSVGSDSSSIGYGGAIYNLVNSNPNLNKCTFTGNSSIYCGGAICNEENSNPEIKYCIFISNNAQHGGAIHNYNNCNPIITNTIMSKNNAQYGGAIKNSESETTLINCTLTENYAAFGGGIWNAWYGSASLENCILWNNSDQFGTSETAQIHGTSSVPGIPNNEQPVTRVNYCCIEGLTGTLGGEGNIAEDPLFYNPDSNDYHLKSQGWRFNPVKQNWTHDDVTSPCIDAGNPESPLFDEPESIDGDISNNWGQNTRINMGAYGGTKEASIGPPD